MSIRSRLTSRMGCTVAALLLLTVNLVGCADLFDGLTPEINDSQETLEAKQKVAKLTAELAKLKAETETEIKRLNQELENEQKRAAMLLDTERQSIMSKIFPAREFHYAAGVILILALIAAFILKNPLIIPSAIFGSALISGYAALQTLVPWAMAAVYGVIGLIAVVWFIAVMRREKAIGIMAKAIESDQDTKTVIKGDGKVAKFVEKFIRPHLKKLAA